jgi:hypothetical protein
MNLQKLFEVTGTNQLIEIGVIKLFIRGVVLLPEA